MTSVDPFAPDGVEWTPVSPRLIGVRIVGAGISALVLAVVIAAGTLVSRFEPLWLGLALPVIGFAVSALLIPRRVRAWGYAEREDDLLVRRGVVFRALTVVPYGRMQYVDVNAGPVDRLFGWRRCSFIPPVRPPTPRSRDWSPPRPRDCVIG